MRGCHTSYAAGLVLLAVLMGSCKKDETTTAPESMGPALTAGQASFSLHVGDSGSTTISGGTAPYILVDKGDTTKAFVSLAGSSLTVRAIGVGSSRIIVGDNSSPPLRMNIEVAVSVPPLIAGQTSFNLLLGDSASTTISGGTPPYVLASNGDTTKVLTSLSGSLLTVRAVGVGSSSITVGDHSSPVLSTNIGVVVSVPPLTANPPEVTLVGTTPQNVTITAGLHPYSIYQQPAPGLATAQFIDPNLDTVVVVITGVSTATGATAVVIRDASVPPRSVTVGITKVQ